MGPMFLTLAVVLDLITATVTFGSYPKNMQFDFTSCMGPERARETGIPLFLPDYVLNAVYFVFIIVGAFHLLAMVFIVCTIINHNMRVGGLIGGRAFNQRKQKNVMTFKQEMFVFLEHLATMVIFGFMLHAPYGL